MTSTKITDEVLMGKTDAMVDAPTQRIAAAIVSVVNDVAEITALNAHECVDQEQPY